MRIPKSEGRALAGTPRAKTHKNRSAPTLPQARPLAQAPIGSRRVPPAPVVDLDGVRFARHVERLHALGPRALHALLAELAAKYLLREPVEAAVGRYVERLTPSMVEAASAARWPR